MTVNHVPSPLSGCTFDLLGFLSEAEGFVFLSGFVAGLTYTRLSREQSDTVMRRRALTRARTIYLYHVATFVALFFVIRLFGRHHGQWQHWYDLYHQGPIAGILTGLALLNQPQYLDILPMYCVFVAIIPLAIVLFNRHRSWAVIVASVAVWTAEQFGALSALGSLIRPRQWPIHLGDFDIFAWQFLFLAGLFLGHRRYMIGQSGRRPNRIVLWYVGLAGIAFFLLRWHLFFVSEWADQAESLALKSTVGPVRVLNFAAVYYLMAWACRDLKPGALINSLAYLGRHSLQVFTWHVLVINVINLLYDRGWTPGGFVQTITLLVCVGSAYLPAWLLERRRRVTS